MVYCTYMYHVYIHIKSVKIAGGHHYAAILSVCPCALELIFYIICTNCCKHNIYIYVIPRSVATIVPLFLKPFLSGRCAFAPFHHHFTYKCYIDITNEYTHRLCPSLDRLHAMCYTNIRTYMYICGRHMIPINIFHCFCQKSKTFHVVIRTSDDVVIMLVFLPFYFFCSFLRIVWSSISDHLFGFKFIAFIRATH